jgi:hypothetical protein
MTKIKLVCAVVSSLIASAAVGDEPATPTTPGAPAAEASIPFADRDGIYNWQVIDDRTVLIQGQCPLTSLVEAPPPPRKVKANKAAPPSQ